MMAAGVRWCVLVTVTLNWLTIAPLNAGPVSINPAISPFGRNIRPITCKSKTGQMGTCMFAMDCTRMNGQHLGTCIDRFYFGSCCAPSDSVMDFPPTTTEGFNGANDLGFSSSLPPLAPVSPLLTMTTSQHPNILADLTTTTTTASSAVPTLGVTETSAAPPTTTTVSSTTVGVVTNPTLAEILASTPLSTLLANPSIHPSSTTEATQTTLKATTQQPSIGTDLPSSFSPVEEVVNVTTTTTPVTTTTTTTTTTITTAAAAIILDMTQSTSTTLSPTTTPEIGTTTIASTTTLPSTTVSSAPPQAETTAATTPGLTNPAELTAVGSSSASPVALSPEESTATDSSLGDEQDEITTLEPVTDLPSASLEPVVVPVAETEIPPPSTEQTVEVTTVEDSVEDGVTDIRPESTDANEEEVVTGSSVAVQTETQGPITTTTSTPIPTTAVVTEVITKAPATSPASPSTTTAVPDTTTVIVSTSSSTSTAPETTITSTTASPSSAILPETTTPVVSITTSSSPVTTTTLVSSTTTISEELSTSQPETFVDTTDVPHWITGDPIDSSGNESTTTPTIVSTTFAELNDTVEGPTVQFQNYREGSTLHLFSSSTSSISHGSLIVS
uniref:Serine proteinase stubble n=1 Tax=Daphnia galeata TaxID=27404 RepID=A0A8J2RQ38_9CRUS|nr:unnamed protein product [Daphnia galeata]